ncbi:DMT family transporter [Candidatus Nitrotoga sp. M5]|uniref:DMT family transporter n=1 Tax=Candidatus Nitrotoga sp. M5 TaxID=2890409 RepID=UPI001EF698DF|nr:DMT family transporter [Candidatus Nitrotoga sp. M5]CAH1388269.1 Threonine/homoserine efflux transporter RhtA [Candidatus Nitrotoga sp. M5]
MGALWMLVAGFLFGCMGVFVKLGAEYFSHIELVFYRSLLGLLMIYAVIRQRGLSLSTHHLKQHLWRGISGTIALMLYFYCITVLPLATAVTLNYTAPLYLSILTMLVFKDHFRPAITGAILLGFCGVILLLHPTLAQDQLIPGLVGLISGLLAGIAYLNVKQLGLSGEPGWRVVFYFSLIAAISSGVGMLLGTIHPITVPGLFILIGLGSTATLAQLAMTRAYHTGKTLVAGSLSYSTVIFASIFGMILWGETLPLMGWIGMGLIIAGGVLSLKLAPKHGGA